MATVSKQYGLKLPISKIREIAGTDKQGISVYEMVMLELTKSNQFTEIGYSELSTIDGGAISFGVACLIVGAVTVKVAWYGFLAGCAYELILGK